MMESCPKCVASEVYRVEIACHAPLRRGSSTTVPVKWFTQMYVCADCGYTESYVRKEDLPKVEELAERQARLSAAAESLSIVS